MAVRIDYSLFYLRRTREERAAGHDTTEALRIAAHTSGRAIVVSGLTVMVALAGLFLTGIDVFSGVAVGTIVVVGVAVLGSLTFLPAILSMLGKWTERGRIPFLGRRRTVAHESRFWGMLARAAVAALHGEVAASHGAIREPISTAMFGNDQVLVVSVPLAGSGTDTASNNALATLRTQALPGTPGKVPGINYSVAGLTAGNHDFDAQLAKTVPWVFVFVLGLAFLLLLTSSSA